MNGSRLIGWLSIHSRLSNRNWSSSCDSLMPVFHHHEIPLLRPIPTDGNENGLSFVGGGVKVVSGHGGYIQSCLVLVAVFSIVSQYVVVVSDWGSAC